MNARDRAHRKSDRELSRELLELAQMPNVRVFESERDAARSWAKYQVHTPTAGEWRPGGRRLRHG